MKESPKSIDPEDVGYLRLLLNTLDRDTLAIDAEEDPEAFAEMMGGVERLCTALEEVAPLCRRCRTCATVGGGELCAWCRDERLTVGDVIDMSDVPY